MGNNTCPLCWANGLLKGGRVIGQGDLFFAYVFEDEDGAFKNALIVPKEHHADLYNLPEWWGGEFGILYCAVTGLLKDEPHNAYWNVGFTAGQRIMNHWHVHVIPRRPGQPASDMGLGLLISKYNELAVPTTE